MTDTVFTNTVTLTDDDWFNDVNRLHYTIFADPANLTAVKATLHAAPGAIGGTTPAAGSFTILDSGKVTASVAATTSSFVALATSSGDGIQVIPNAAGNGGTIRTVNNAQSDFEPMTFVFETLDLRYRTGAATSASAASINTAGALTLPFAVIGDATTDSTSITTGAFQTDGGLGVVKALWVGGLANIAGAVTAQTTMTVGGAFGCNTKAAQTAFASGGALNAYGAGVNGFDTGANASALHALVVAIRAALVANGIMS